MLREDGSNPRAPRRHNAGGRRHVAWEREPEKLWRAPVSSQNGKQTDKKMAILRNTLKAMVQRELEHRGFGKADRGFEAKLIAWVEAAV